MKWHSPNIYANKKKLGNIPNVKFFTVDPYFGGIFKVERPKEAHFGIFRHMGGVIAVTEGID